MRIVVVNTAASEGGALSILRDFASYVRENEKDHEWIFILSDKYIQEEHNIKVMVIKNSKSKFSRFSYDLFLGKKIINNLKPEIVFSLQNTPIYGLNIPQIIYLHQSIPFQKVKNYSFFKEDERKFAFIQHILGKYIKVGLGEADNLIVQTKWMKNSVKNYMSGDKITVIPPSINFINIENYLVSEYSHNKFIYPTSTAPYKNIDLILQACRKINQEYPKLEYTVYLTVNEKYGIKNVESIGKIPREDVLEHLSSKVLLFPSYIETYGLPLAEGKLMSTIILASDTEFSNELLNNYENGYLLDPFDPEKLAELMIKCINGGVKRHSHVAINSNQNTWENVCQVIFGEVKKRKIIEGWSSNKME